MNVSMDTDMLPAISPFQLVYGRRPRLAGKDITFPAKITPAYPVAKSHTKYVNNLCHRLQNLRLAALDRQIERKQIRRRKHDEQRPDPSPLQPRRGHIVYLNVPTSTPKLRYQWTQPVWLVVKVAVTTVILKPLVSPAGRKHLMPTLKTANRKKVRVAGPRPSDFWLGAIVRRRFGQTWFLGTVYDMVTDEGKTFYKVQYRDGDTEELDQGQVWDHVIYHPRMDAAKYTPKELPKTHEIVLFADGQQPKVGQVEAVDDTESLPITIQLWKPSSKAKTLAAAKFIQASNDEDSNLVRVRPEQILLHKLQFLADGHLDANSQRRVKRILRKPRSTKPTAKDSSSRPTVPTSSRPSSPANPSSNQPATAAVRNSLQQPTRIKLSNNRPAASTVRPNRPNSPHKDTLRSRSRYNLRRR